MRNLSDFFSERLTSEPRIMGSFDPASMGIILCLPDGIYTTAINLMERHFGGFWERSENERDAALKEFDDIWATWNDIERDAWCRVMGTFHHERMHYWQSISTPIGYFVSRMCRANARAVHECLNCVLAEDAEDMNDWAPPAVIRIPMRQWYESLPDIQLKKLLHPFLYTWMATDSVISVFDGTHCIPYNELVGHCVTGIGCLHFPEMPDVNDGDLIPKRLWPEKPVLPGPFNGVYLGCRAAYEEAAKQQELWSVAQDGMTGTHMMEYIRERFHGVYGAALMAVMTPLLIGCGRHFNFVLKSLLDLSLLAPIEVVDGFFGRRFWWEDIHPGWRFIRAAAEAQSLPRKYYEDENYEVLTNVLCSNLKWPTPGEVADASIKRASVEPDAVSQLHIRACKLRLKTPRAFAFPHQHFPELIELLPTPFVIDPRGVHQAEGPEIAGHLLGIHYDCFLTRQMVLGNELSYPVKFVPGANPFDQELYEHAFGVSLKRFVPLG